MKPPSSKGRRSLVYSTIVLLVISTFLLGYFYFFIPLNRKVIHKNGFLILRTIAQNIQEKTKAHTLLFDNFYPVEVRKPKESQLEEILKKRIQENDQNLPEETQTRALVQVTDISGHSRQKNSLLALFERTDSTDVRIEKGHLVFSYLKSSDRNVVRIAEPLDRFLQQILSTQKAELFESYLLGKIYDGQTKLLYHDDDLNIRLNERIDTLLPRGAAGYLAGIRDLRSGDLEQKMFYYPFELGNDQLVLCGFVKAASYHTALRKVPFYFVYPLVILFLLVLSSLPIIKFRIMDANQQVRIKDVVFFGLSVFMSAGTLTQIIIHFLLWKGEEKRVEQNLKTLSAQIESSFQHEVERSYAQLLRVDRIINTDSLRQQHRNVKYIDFSSPVRQAVKTFSLNPSCYYHFERVSWIDSAGDQRFKAELNGNPVFTNVSKRSYFRTLQEGEGFPLPDHPRESYSWEPLYSWTNTDLNITLSKQSGPFIVAMATRMYSLMQTILPLGYGFCLIDQQGRVQVHSDGNRSLRENFFDKIEPADPLKGAVATRQSKTINDILAYGMRHMIYVQPLDHQPFHLVTFYDTGYIVPVNMRILIFALLFCSLSFFFCILLWLILARSGLRDHPLVYCPLDCLNWLVPRPKETAYYWHASLYLFLYTCLPLGLVFHNYLSKFSNLNVLALLILSPLNVIGTLYIIRAAFIRPISRVSWFQVRKKRADILLYIAVHLATSLLFFGLPDKRVYHMDAGFLTCQLLFNTVMWVYALSKRSSRLLLAGLGGAYVFRYSLLVTFLVIGLSVLPSALYTWYAHNQELVQTAKRQQLYLANTIMERSHRLREEANRNQLTPVPAYYLDSLQFARGIYTIYQDSVALIPNAVRQQEGSALFEELYFTFAEQFGNSYYNLQSYDALKDTSDDKAWNWQIKDNRILLSYNHALPRSSDRFLSITSRLPDRFVYLNTKNSPIRLVLLLLLILLLVAGLFAWIRRNIEQIFLVRYLQKGRSLNSNATSSLVDEYYKGSFKAPDLSLCGPSSYKKFSIPASQQQFYQYEKEVIAKTQKGKGLYHFIWNRCSDKEKYLLFDFVQDGLMNYKNTSEIIGLMQKGVLIVHDDRLRMFNPGFRAFVLTRQNDPEMEMLQRQFKENSNWHSLRLPIIILLLGIATLVFFTQQTVFDKLLVLAGGVSTLLTLFFRFFGGDGKAADKKSAAS